MPDDCLFCRLASGAIATHEVFRSDRIVAFLDTSPIRPGHTLIVPIAHFDYFDDLPPDLAADIMHLGQRLAKRQKALMRVDRAGFLYTGGDCAHVHAHVLPLVEKEDLTSRRYIQEQNLTFRSLPSPGDDALATMAAELAKGLGQ